MLANGIIIGLHRSSAQLFLMFLILNILLTPNINTNANIIINISRNNALLNDHNSNSAAIFLLTANNQVLPIFSLHLQNLD